MIDEVEKKSSEDHQINSALLLSTNFLKKNTNIKISET